MILFNPDANSPLTQLFNFSMNLALLRGDICPRRCHFAPTKGPIAACLEYLNIRNLSAVLLCPRLNYDQKTVIFYDFTWTRDLKRQKKAQTFAQAFLNIN